ncbi:MAG: type IV pili twitching motility protein PilT [Candidatus Eremiobacter antarcticus]|nr:type IV pilus twitching motility protein PilT [Candidatus Eremiobacteraeota bacterium]MBC5807389.1 type IV pilus twitching motility protein PilT [Candidatus Eremiobacteraeota bacterium]PZR63140.1 MAG: type IV pili twitching motility protein PilT [Candidatus Eremiobacter sp. RRmetagenome_bin22]
MYPHSLDDLLISIVEKGASDLHVVAGSPPAMRLHGRLDPIVEDKLDSADCQSLVTSILTKEQIDLLNENREIDLAYAMVGVARFRVNACFERGSISATFRNIPDSPPWLEEMGFSPILAQMTQKARGLVLVTGPTGSGKSTTLAAMINYLNRTRNSRVVTIEDPIEFLHSNVNSIITQRELHRDTHSFGNALRSALRQDPDVILIGEMRDLETIALALTAAETGHLVFGTLHVTSAAESINRIIDVFPPEQQEQIRLQLAGVLEGVFTQTLVPKVDGAGRICAMEILIGSPAVRNLIRENKPAQITSAMQTGQSFGMQTLDRQLAKFVNDGSITLDAALEKSINPDDLRRYVSGNDEMLRPRVAASR